MAATICRSQWGQGINETNDYLSHLSHFVLYPFGLQNNKVYVIELF